MSASSSEIEREVEASRANLEDTVEALRDKMSVGQMVDEASRYFGDTGGGEVLSKLGEQAKANPLPLALVGVGLLWLISGKGQPNLRVPAFSRGGDRYGSDRYDYESLGDEDYRRTFGQRSVYAGASHTDYSGYSTGPDEDWDSSEGGENSAGMIRRRAHDLRDGASSAASGIGSTVSSVAGAVGSAASGVASAVGSAASAVGSAASGLGQVASTVGRTAYSAVGTVAGGARGGAGAAYRGGSSAYRGASHLGSDAYYGASRFGRGARRTMADVLDTEPLVLAGLGIAVGAAIGAFLPGTDVEDRYLGETRDRLREDAEAFAREKFEQGKAVAGEALRTAKEEADAQGLTSTGEESIVGRVGQVARSTMEKVRESAAEKGLMSTDTEGSSESGSSTGSGGSGSSTGTSGGSTFGAANAGGSTGGGSTGGGSTGGGSTGSGSTGSGSTGGGYTPTV